MKLKEFDLIRKYLPDDTEITINSVPKTEPAEDEMWAIWDCNWGNHDGRFNVLCRACGWMTPDIPARQLAETRATYLHKPCPKCGKTFVRKDEIKK